MYSLSPGIVDSNMQEIIRNSDSEVYPWVGTFQSFKDENNFNSCAYVADKCLQLAKQDQGEVYVDLI